MQNALILLAGGNSRRFGNSFRIPKQFIKIENLNLIEFFLYNLDEKIFDIIQIVIKESYKKKYLSQIKERFPQHNINFVISGKSRQESSKNGVSSLIKYKPKKILIHDAARPLVSNKLLKKLLKYIDKYDSCIPFINNNDLIRYKKDKSKIFNEETINTQTPQAFNFKSIVKAHKLSNVSKARDDGILIQNLGKKIKFIEGENSNIKITYKKDIELFNKIKINEYRSGIGYDIHKFDKTSSKKKLILCGVKIDYYPLLGHSDADVGYHAICDSIFGALSKRDIGYFFNNKNKKWKNADSKIFIDFCYNKLKLNNYIIVNLDINFICEKPKINNYVEKMKNNISKLLKIRKNQISIKATTNEKIGFIGKGEGIAAEAIIQIKK